MVSLFKFIVVLISVSILSQCQPSSSQSVGLQKECDLSYTNLVAQDSNLTSSFFGWQEQIAKDAKVTNGQIDTVHAFKKIDSLYSISKNMKMPDAQLASFFKDYYSYLYQSSLSNARLTLLSYQLEHPTLEQANQITGQLDSITIETMKWFDKKNLFLDSFLVQCKTIK